MLDQNCKVQTCVTYGNTQETGSINADTYQKDIGLLEGRVTLTHYFGAGSLLRTGVKASNSNRMESWDIEGRYFNNQMGTGF